ncbi:MAG: hypothetical protein ACHQ4H_16935 [Ktedonobacterales bacterium]
MFTPHGAITPIQVIPPLILLLLCLTFWGWMFRDMVGNADLPRSAKDNWTITFVLLNVFGAVIYYNTVYRNQH